MRTMSIQIAPKLLAIALCGLMLGACGTSGRKKGLVELQSFGVYSGIVKHEGSPNALVLVTLLDAANGSAARYGVVDAAGRFEIFAKRGDYRVLSFVDTDSDFRLDEGEPWAITSAAAVEGAGQDDVAPLNTLSIPSSAAAATAPVQIDLSEQALPTAEDIRKAALGRIVKPDDPHFSPEAGIQSLWHPVDYLKAKKAGVFLLEEFDPARIPVIFVNGIGGSPSELMPIASRLDKTRFQPIFITYPSGLSIEFNGWWLYRTAVEIRARRGNLGDTIIIAHSMGGLIARSMLNRVVASGGHAPLAFISISTPWGGHAASSEHGSRVAAVPVWADLVPGSPFLSSLYKQPLPDDLHYYLFFSYSGSGRMVRGSDDGTVTIPSMLTYEAQDQSRWTYGFAESHTSIVKSEKVIAAVMKILDEESKRARVGGSK